MRSCGQRNSWICIAQFYRPDRAEPTTVPIASLPILERRTFQAFGEERPFVITRRFRQNGAMIHSVRLLAFLGCIGTATLHAQAPAVALTRLLEEAWQYDLKEDPLFATE